MLNQVQHDDGRGGTGVLRPYPPTPLSLSLSKAARKLSYTREICLNLRNEARAPHLPPHSSPERHSRGKSHRHAADGDPHERPAPQSCGIRGRCRATITAHFRAVLRQLARHCEAAGRSNPEPLRAGLWRNDGFLHNAGSISTLHCAGLLRRLSNTTGTSSRLIVAVCIGLASITFRASASITASKSRSL